MSYPESSSHNVPPMSQVGEAYSEIVKHNNAHTGFGFMFGTIIEAVYENPEPIDETAVAVDIYSNIGYKLGQKTVEGDMSAELQDMFHGDLFMRAGLKMIPAGSHIVDGQGERVSSTRLDPFIENSELFFDFLKGTTSEDAQTESGLTLLVDVARNIKRLISDGLGKKEDNEDVPEKRQQLIREAGEDSLRTWVKISDDYERLGFSSDTLREQVMDSVLVSSNPESKRRLAIFNSLEQYVNYWGAGLLPEFIIAANEGYIVPEDEYYGWAPARWAEDMSPDELSAKWEKAMDFIVDLKTKNGSVELVALAQDNLSAALENSQTHMSMQQKTAEAHYRKELEKWKAHGEKNYEITDEDGRTRTVRSPNEAGLVYFKNNRIVLEAARLRFQQL